MQRMLTYAYADVRAEERAAVLRQVAGSIRIRQHTHTSAYAACSIRIRQHAAVLREVAGKQTYEYM
jgi:hypothetical protein